MISQISLALTIPKDTKLQDSKAVGSRVDPGTLGSNEQTETPNASDHMRLTNVIDSLMFFTARTRADLMVAKKSFFSLAQSKKETHRKCETSYALPETNLAICNEV